MSEQNTGAGDRQGLLVGRVAMITGASSGIGAAAGRLFAAEGAAVVLMARRTEKLNAVVDEITERGGRALAVPGDVAVSDDVRRVVEAAVWLCSDRASFVTGTAMPVDGGISAQAKSG